MSSADAGDLDASTLLVLGDLSRTAGEEPAPTKAISVFQLAQPIDLLPHHSAMVPFLDVTISTRSLVWFSDFSAEAERAIVLRNDTPNTLAEGPLAVFGGGGFLGEAEIDSLKPGERRFARIGRDPEIELTVLGEQTVSQEQRLSFESASLHVHQIRTREMRLRFGSRSDHAREVYVALHAVTNASIEGSDRLDYDPKTRTAFAVFDAAPGEPRALHLIIREGLVRSARPGAITSDELQRLAELPTLPASERAIVARAVEGARALEGLRDQKEELAGDIEAVLEDVRRLREHSATLSKGEAGGAQGPLMQRLLERDEQLRALKAKERVFAADVLRREQALGQVLAPVRAPE